MPAPPLIVSLPSPPVMTLSSALPVMELLPELPTTFSIAASVSVPVLALVDQPPPSEEGFGAVVKQYVEQTLRHLA